MIWNLPEDPEVKIYKEILKNTTYIPVPGFGQFEQEESF